MVNVYEVADPNGSKAVIQWDGRSKYTIQYFNSKGVHMDASDETVYSLSYAFIQILERGRTMMIKRL
jgi:phage terminase large subunit